MQQYVFNNAQQYIFNNAQQYIFNNAQQCTQPVVELVELRTAK